MGQDKEVVILQHVASENAGTILDYLSSHQIPFRQVNLFERDFVWPNLSGVRALVVMGGPMNVYEEDKFPFLIRENSYIRDAVQRNIPYLGICLGSQLLAKAMNAKVYKAKQEEIGWNVVDFTADARHDKLFGVLAAKKLKVLQWHGDTFDLPRGATHLAFNSAVPNQAFAVGERFYGLQFHVEVNRTMIDAWFKKREDLQEILSEYDIYLPELKKITEKIYKSFFGMSA